MLQEQVGGRWRLVDDRMQQVVVQAAYPGAVSTWVLDRDTR